MEIKSELLWQYHSIIYNEGYYPLEAEGNKCVLKGEWEIHLDVPEKMYNRSEEYYKVVSCENDKFDVYTSKVMDTGFELGILISDIEKPVYPEIIREKALTEASFYYTVLIPIKVFELKIQG